MVIVLQANARGTGIYRTTFDPRSFPNDAGRNATCDRKRRNVMRGHGIGCEEGAAPNYDTLRDRRVCRDPRTTANSNLRKITWAKSVGSIYYSVIPAYQNGVWSKLHLVLQRDSSMCVQPAARRDKDVPADFKAIRKVNRHLPSDL
jgi:hypothetical protein